MVIGPLGSLQKKLFAERQGPNSKDEKVISLLSPFRNRRDMVAYRGHAFRAIFETDRHCVAYRGAVTIRDLLGFIGS